ESRQIEAAEVGAALAEPNEGIRVLEVKADRSTLRRLHAAMRAAL
ncbi:MAG: 2-succinyl-5-enolpyruvyl-6-hydroxy-3-cyclohexene-carboxylate synthase, partial [Actinomycetota bacterium]|nr:2-succinyl-5-enolpyruvyl-6-hydroxy-3-cyclohexene-carboxylate synthase [Actinomycetota bacterium]